MSLFQEEMTASDCAKINMHEYSAYTIQSKFPNTIDGLKPVARRILLVMHKNDGVSKEATIAGRVMEMHPHGDASIAAAISTMAQPFSNIFPVVGSKSNLGTYVGDDPAAPRYVDVYAAEIAEDLFFRNTDFSALKMVPCESEHGVEPANFVPVIPTTLCFPVLGIGCGYKTETSAISLANVCKLTKKFIELKYRHEMTFHNEVKKLTCYMLPDFPTICNLRNSSQIISEYRKGNYECPFVIDGTLEISKDSITIVTLPPEKPFGKVTHDAGMKAVKEKDSWFHEHFIDMADFTGRQQGSTRGKFVCQLRRGENPFEVLSTFKRLMQFTSHWRPWRYYYEATNGMTMENPLSLVDKWTEARYKVVLGGLKQKLKDLQEQFHKLMALIKIVDHAKEICDIFRNAKDEDSTVSILVNRFDLSPFQAKYLQTLPLKSLTAKGKQELLDSVEKVKAKNKELQSKFNKVDEEMIKTIEDFEKKHVADYPAKCTSATYIGAACYKDTGWILIEKLDEVDDIINNFDSENIQVKMFQYPGNPDVIGTDDPECNPEFDPPKYIHATNVESIPGNLKYLAIRVGDGGAFVKRPSLIGLLERDPVPVCDECTVISKSGRTLVKVTDKLVRATMSGTSPTIKDVLAFSPITDEEVIVVHCNSKIPGQINIDRVKGNGKISRQPIGETKVLGVFRIGNPVMFSIPADTAARSPVKHMYFKDLSKFVSTGSTLKLFLVKKRTSDNQSLVPYKHRSALFTIAG